MKPMKDKDDNDERDWTYFKQTRDVNAPLGLISEHLKCILYKSEGPVASTNPEASASAEGLNTALSMFYVSQHTHSLISKIITIFSQLIRLFIFGRNVLIGRHQRKVVLLQYSSLFCIILSLFAANASMEAVYM